MFVCLFVCLFVCELQDVRFNPEVDVVSGKFYLACEVHIVPVPDFRPLVAPAPGYEPAAILAMPVRVTRKEGGKDSKPIAVAVAYDKKRSKVYVQSTLYVCVFTNA